MSDGDPRPDLIDKRSTAEARALAKSPQWRELTRNHPRGSTAAFFCYGDEGADELDVEGRPKILRRKARFDPEREPTEDPRHACAPPVWRCRYVRRG